MYLAQVSNALVDFDKLGSFEEYKNRVQRNAERQRAQNGEQAAGVSEKRLKLITAQADNILKNFTPPPKR